MYYTSIQIGDIIIIIVSYSLGRMYSFSLLQLDLVFFAFQAPLACFQWE